MKLSILFVIIFLLSIVLLPGCGGDTARQTSSPQRMCLSAERQQAMDTAAEVLRGMHFSIDKFDVQAGIIRTHPLEAAKSFELWRDENTTAVQQAQSDIHSQRRIVSLNFTRSGDEACIFSKVEVERLYLPSAPTTGFSEGRISMEEMKKSNYQWIPMDSDEFLERRILDKIQFKIAGEAGR